MDFTRDPVHEELVRGIRELCARFPDSYWMEHDQAHAFPWAFYEAVASGGWLGITVPTQYNGAGLGVTEAGLVEREIAASGAGMNGCSAVHMGIFGVEPIIQHGSESLKERFLPRLVTGDLHVSFAITEPDAGTDTTNVSTFATKTDGGYVVSGKKVWISKALEAERLVLLCRTSERTEKRTEGLTLFFAPMDESRVEVRPIAKMGRHAVDTNELFIEELFVADEDLIGEEGRGFRALLAGLNAERILAANATLGIGRAAVRRSVEYACDRVVFGRPIGQNQGIQFPIAEANIYLDAAEALCDNAAWRYDHGLPCGREANTAKYVAAEAAFAAADRAVSTHGGYGYSAEYHVERYFREARLMRLAPISQEMVLNYIGEHVLGLPRSY